MSAVARKLWGVRYLLIGYPFALHGVFWRDPMSLGFGALMIAIDGSEGSR